MEQHAEKDKDLEEPIFVDCVEKNPDLTPGEGCQDVHRNENRHAQPTNTMQHKSQHGALTAISQAGCQADISLQAHLCLLKKFFGKGIYDPIQVFFIKG